MIFNVGAPRSGTFWLQRIVTSHPDVSAVPSETHLFSFGIAPLLERFQHSVRSSPEVGLAYVDRDRLIDAVRDLCDAVFIDFLDPDASRVAERTPLHVLHLELIAEIYPDARFVHIIRDGRDVARSIAAREWGAKTIEGAAEEWRECVRAARRAALPTTRYREVRYESLLTEPKGTIAELYAWLGLPATPEVVGEGVLEARRPLNVDRARPEVGTGKWRDDFSPTDLTAFARVAGDLLAELGYAAPSAEGAASEGSRGAPAFTPSRRSRGLRGWARRRSPSASPSNVVKANQALVGRLIGHLQERAAGPALDLLAADARVSAVSREGTLEARGPEARQLLVRTLERDAAFAGRQIRGDVYPALPTQGVVLTYELPDGSLAERLAFVTCRGDEITDLVLYLLPNDGSR